MPRWTDEQQTVIKARGGNLLVSAAAGAGKTAVLVERIIRLLCDGDSPPELDRLLVVTFTEAAAAEMRERIGTALEKEIRETGRRDLQRQLALLPGASISTLHSFCLDVMRRYFYLLDLDPSFSVADERDISMLQRDVAGEVLEEEFSRADNGPFMELASHFGGKQGDEGLESLVLRIYRFAWSNPWPHEWLSEAAHRFTAAAGSDADAVLDQWLAPVRQHLAMTLSQADFSLCQAIRLCRLPGYPDVYEKTLVREREQVTRLRSRLDEGWAALRESWLGVAFDRLPPAKGVDEERKKQVKLQRDQAKQLLLKNRDLYFIRSLDEYLAEVRELAPLMMSLTTLVDRFAQTYSEAKKRLGIVDFNDLEHYCLRALLDEKAPAGSLIPSGAAAELRERYEYVLVDEYQDINPVQDAILNLVSRQGTATPNLFMVGDVKQSIYRFRLGDPSLFLGRYKAYPSAEGGPDRRVLLSKNFRCSREVVDAVNYFFRQLMSEEVCEIEYNSEAELVCGAVYPDAEEVRTLTGPVEVCLIDRTAPPADDNGDDTEPPAAEDDDLTALEKEAAVVALKIREIMGDNGGKAHVLDKESGHYRPVSYRDIVVLLRATAGRANRLAEILARAGIPAYADLNTGYFAATEVETMLSLLKITDNPCQDIPLAAVLRSPLVGLTAEDLATVRKAGGKDCDFYTAVNAAAKSGLPGISDILLCFLERLDRWRSAARRGTLAGFIAGVYRETGYDDYVAGLTDGAQRQANLRALFHRARQFDRFSRQGLSRFLQFIEQLRLSGEDLGTARTLGEKEDVVRIMSIHKSKGLEFPVVFLCDTGKIFNFRDQHEDVLVHRRLGLGPLVVRPSGHIRYPSLPYLSLKLAGEAENRAEEMRILYVALTRAREKLVLVGSVRNLVREYDTWCQILAHEECRLPANYLARARTYLDWLGRALVRHPEVKGKTSGYAWLANDCSRFCVSFWQDGYHFPFLDGGACPAVTENNEAILSLRPVTADYPAETAKEAAKRLSFRYPYTVPALPAKMSVSELKRRFAGAEEAEDAAPYFPESGWPVPSFALDAPEHLAAQRGTLYHCVMQQLDLNGPLDSEGILRQLAAMAENGILSPAEAASVEPGRIADFFSCEAGELILKHAGQTYREWPFTMAIPAGVAGGGAAGAETVLIQGIVDLMADTPDGIILVDFKTDSVNANQTAAAADKHREQLRYYAAAAQTILKKNVAAAYVYFFTAGKCERVI